MLQAPSTPVSDRPVPWEARSDDALLDQAAAGQTQAFETLVVRYQDRVYNLLLRMTNSPDEAEELAQETFLKAYRALHTFRRGSRFYTWLFRIAVNAGYSRGRRHALQQRIEGIRLDAATADGSGPGDYVKSKSPSPSKEMEQRQLRERVQEGLSKLDAEHRTVLLLREIEGLDYATLAQALDIPLGAVKSRLHRARRTLARVLKDLHPHRPTAARVAAAPES